MEERLKIKLYPILKVFKENNEFLVPFITAWRYRMTKSTELIDTVVDGRKIKVRSYGVELIEKGLCTVCLETITGIIASMNKDMEVSFEQYIYLFLYSKSGLCMSCIEKFLEDTVDAIP